MKVIGVTGGIATGKTVVSKLLSLLLGSKLINADEIVHKLIDSESSVKQKIVQCFGESILNSDSSVNRGKLAQVIFSDNSKRIKLEDIIHPEVKKIIEEKLKHYRENGEKWVVLDIPLLFEAKMEHMVDSIIVVTRGENAQIDTLKKEKGLSLEQAKKRIKSQLPLSEKIKRADFVVDNNNSLSDTEKQVREIHACLKG